MTGEKQQGDFDLSKEAVNADSNQVVPDPLEIKIMVAISAKVFFVSDCSNNNNIIIVSFFCFTVYNFSFCVASCTRGAQD